MTVDAAVAKSCCTTVYASAAARYLLGESFHPGGAGLTEELIRALHVGPSSLALDVASGLGTSAFQLGRAVGCDVLGIDLAPDNVEAATARSARERMDARVRFRSGDAESLPLEDASVDAVLCECALCLFPDKTTAVREMARVLRPGGRLALSDVTATTLPPGLETLEAYVACLGGAIPLDDIARLFADSGFRLERVMARNAVLVDIIERVEVRLRVARLLGVTPLTGQLDRVDSLVAAARAAVREGALGYGVVIAERISSQ